MLSSKMQKAFEANGGILSLKEAETYGLSKQTLNLAYLRGDISKLERGLYMLSDDYYDEMLLTQHVFSKGIFSHESAVMLYNYSNWIPKRYYMTFPHGYNSDRFSKYMVEPTFATEKYYGLGITTAEDWDGNMVRAYDREKTLLDILRSKAVMFEVKDQVIENYLDDPEHNFDKLMEYAEIMNMKDIVERKVLAYA